MIDAAGAPRDQGVRQGREARASIRDALGSTPDPSRSARGAARRVLRNGPLRSLRRFLPQQHERLAGIAAGARVRLADLEATALVARVRSRALERGGCIHAAFEPAPSALVPIVRQSRPDAGGFASVELTAAPFAGCMAGVNSEGIAVCCLDDGPPGSVPLRLLAQDVLLRTRTLASAIDHLERRGGYLRATGGIVIGSPGSAAAWLRMDAGRATAIEPVLADRSLDAMELRVDPASRTLEHAGRKYSAGA